MSKALLTFSNGETLKLHEGQLLTPISLISKGEDQFASKGAPCELWTHTHDGLVPSIVEFICKCDFFQLVDDPNKIYKSSSVVTVENL